MLSGGVRAQAVSPGDELEKGNQPGLHDGRPLAHRAARRARVVGQDRRPSAQTEPARRALLDRFERQVDPDGVLSPDERARRAGHARKAYFARLALRSAQARRKASGASDEAGRSSRPDADQPE
jgi:hypothetical protein